MKKVWIAVGIVVIIGLLVGVNIWNQKSDGNVTVETVTLTEETMAETVMTPGTLELADEQTVYYQAEKGEVEEVLVKEGDTVEKATEVIRYENEELFLEEKQNELQQRLGYLEVNNLREQHRDIDKQIDDDPDNEMLQSEHDQIKLQQQQANIELERGQLQKESIEKSIADLVVKSDIEGTVVTINDQASLGAEQLQQKPLIRIGSLDKLIVKGSISEYDTLKIEEDQPVVLTSDAVPDKEWKGKVKLVSYLPEESDGADMGGSEAGKQYPVEITVEDKIDLKPGFQMLIEIETNKQTVSTLPLSAVKQEDDINYVYIVENSKAKRKEVEVGTVTTDKIEIKDGITKKDAVIIDPSATIKNGMDVNVQ